MTTTEAIKREPQREATGTTAAPRPTDKNIAYPGGGASNKIIVVASPMFQPARSAKSHEYRTIGPKHGRYAQDFDGCIAVAVSRVAFLGPLCPPQSDTSWVSQASAATVDRPPFIGDAALSFMRLDMGFSHGMFMQQSTHFVRVFFFLSRGLYD